jgi:hypothetical protein
MVILACNQCYKILPREAFGNSKQKHYICTDCRSIVSSFTYKIKKCPEDKIFLEYKLWKIKLKFINNLIGDEEARKAIGYSKLNKAQENKVKYRDLIRGRRIISIPSNIFEGQSKDDKKRSTFDILSTLINENEGEVYNYEDFNFSSDVKYVEIPQIAEEEFSLIRSKFEMMQFDLPPYNQIFSSINSQR